MQNAFTVIHSVRDWLPQTMNWVYNQVVHLPPTVDNHIVCKSTENLDRFGLPNIHCDPSTPATLVNRWDRTLFKLGLRKHYRYDFLVNVAREQGAQLLHSHFGHRGWFDLDAARVAGLKQVVTFYGYDVDYLPRQDPRWRARYQDMFAHVNAVLCEGPFMAESIHTLGCPREKIRVYHLGIAVDNIPFRPRTWQPGQPLRILMAASFVEKKGIPYALEALARLRKETLLEITLIGDASNDERGRRGKEEILATIARLGLESAINMLGYQPHSAMLAEAYRHHIFLSPSVTAADGDVEGGAPVSLIEMSASGMMIVSTTHCDIPNVVMNGVSGLLAPERDVDALVERLRWFADHPERWADFAAAGRAHIEADFNVCTQGLRLAKIYADVLK